MSPDPFRGLDRIDPPDQWDEIARRVAASGDDLDVDLDRVVRPHRRGAVLLAAAAAAVALVAGVAVSTVYDAEEGVTVATDPSPGGMPGPCPFTLDPDDVVPPLHPGEGDPEAPAYAGSWRVPPDADLDVPGSWGTLDYGGIPVTVTVYADAASPPPVARRTHPGRTTADTVEVIAWAPVEGSAACRTAEVRAQLPLTNEDRARREREGEDALDLTAYLADPAPSRILRAVRLLLPSDQPTPVPDPCGELAEQDPPRVADGASDSFTGVLADGRRFTVSATDTDITVGVDGADGAGGGTRPDELADLMWTSTGDDVGITVGWLPPDAARVGVLRPDGTVTSEGAVTWATAELFAIPDVGQAPGPDGEDEPWPIVRCTTDGALMATDEHIDREAVLEQQEDDLDAQIDEEGQDLQDRMATCAEQPGTCAPDVTTAVTRPEPAAPATRPDEVWFEAEAWDGHPIYVTRGDGLVCVTATAESEGCSSGDGPGLATVEVPDPETGEDGGVVLLGPRPTGTVSTDVRSATGPVPGAEVTVSPDGEWFVAWVPVPFDDLGFGSDWPVVHRGADGEVVEIP